MCSRWAEALAEDGYIIYIGTHQIVRFEGWPCLARPNLLVHYTGSWWRAAGNGQWSIRAIYGCTFPCNDDDGMCLYPLQQYISTPEQQQGQSSPLQTRWLLRLPEPASPLSKGCCCWCCWLDEESCHHSQLTDQETGTCSVLQPTTSHHQDVAGTWSCSPLVLMNTSPIRVPNWQLTTAAILSTKPVHWSTNTGLVHFWAKVSIVGQYLKVNVVEQYGAIEWWWLAWQCKQQSRA